MPYVDLSKSSKGTITFNNGSKFYCLSIMPSEQVRRLFEVQLAPGWYETYACHGARGLTSYYSSAKFITGFVPGENVHGLPTTCL